MYIVYKSENIELFKILKISSSYFFVINVINLNHFIVRTYCLMTSSFNTILVKPVKGRNHLTIKAVLSVNFFQ